MRWPKRGDLPFWSPPGEISKNGCWVWFNGCWMYDGDTFFELVKNTIIGWKDDRNLVE